jgi:lysozyme
MTDTNNIALDTEVTKINPKGRGGWVAVAVALIMTWEGFAAVGYHSSIDPGGVNTIGYGHIENVTIGEKITKIQAGILLAKDLPRYEAQVERAIHVPMPGYRHGAILSFDYNVGGGALLRSSVARYINAGEWEKGCDALLLYVKSNGQFRQGLLNRRTAERKLCYNQNEPPLPSEEVVKLARVNVDQQTADKEAAAERITPAPKAAPAPKPAPVVQQNEPGIVVTPAPKLSLTTRIYLWFMEK